MKPLETLLRAFAELHPEEAARAFELLNRPDQLRLVKSLPTRVAIVLLERMSPHVVESLLAELDDDRIRQLLSDMPARSAASLLNQLDLDRRTALLEQMPDKAAQSIRDLADYGGDTAGGIMETRVASLAVDLTAQQAISAIRKTSREVLHYLYITDRDRKLVGVITMRDLLLASPRDPIAPIVNRDVLSIPATMDREEVVNLMQERRFLALPVVDFEGRLVGVVRHNEALRAGQQEAFEDLQKIVGAGADERALSPVSTVVKSRLPWLYVNLGTAFLAAAVVGLFEGIIAEVAALAVLLPVVAGQGGNTGSQSLAVVMRGLALREIVPGAKRQVVVKEFWGGLINGILVAVVTSLAVLAWRSTKGDSMEASVALSLVIGLAMIVNMAAAAVSGAIIPLILRALGRDPAQSSSIFLTTVTDIVGFAAFLGFASAFMPYLT